MPTIATMVEELMSRTYSPRTGQPMTAEEFAAQGLPTVTLTAGQLAEILAGAEPDAATADVIRRRHEHVVAR